MSNSKLVTYTKVSPNRDTPRNHKIDTITIHCIVGQWTAKQGCDFFSKSSVQASANYVVGKDGSIGLSVPEGDRSWCSSSSSNDNRAVTIEVASDTKHPYAVTDAAYNALIKLVADICKRNDIKKLLWKGDKSLIGQVSKQNMTVHRWFANFNVPCCNPILTNCSEAPRRCAASATESLLSGLLFQSIIISPPFFVSCQDTSVAKKYFINFLTSQIVSDFDCPDFRHCEFSTAS